MFIKRLVLDNFRSFSHLDLEISSTRNYIYGVNGSGKTTILEAIYFMSISRSFLKTESGSLINFDSSKSKISLILEENKKDNILACEISKNEKSFFLNDEKLKNTSDIISHLLSFYFNPESVFLFKDEPNLRRKLFDIVLSQIDKKYLYALSRYKKILKERNAALAKGYDQDVIDVLKDELVNLSYRIVTERKNAIYYINKIISDIYSNIFGSKRECKILYKTTSPLKDDQEEFTSCLKKLFEEHKSSENMSKMTLLGPHKDNFIFLLDNKDVSMYGSQGENRIAAISLKLALHKYEEESLKRIPVFLLDDILSDLDKTRRDNLLNYLDDKMQVFITGVNEISLQNYSIYKIENHQIRRI